MRERPILMSAPMVLALLAGTKTQTRRTLRDQPCELQDFNRGGLSIRVRGAVYQAFNPAVPPVRCPYGQPGDRLWVRETFAKIDGQTQAWIETDYRATYKHGDRLGDTLGIEKRWRPAIHMPRAASRITLDVTAVRVERLQDISPNDCIAEGAWPAADRTLGRSHEAVATYRALWEKINGAGSWDRNPFVWVVSFSVVRP